MRLGALIDEEDYKHALAISADEVGCVCGTPGPRPHVCKCDHLPDVEELAAALVYGVYRGWVQSLSILSGEYPAERSDAVMLQYALNENGREAKQEAHERWLETL